MTLQDPYLNYRYEGYTNNGQQIETKATGKLGAKFYDETPYTNQINQILKLKKKMKHKDLEERGFLIHEKPEKYEGREVEVDQPIYELYDLPNQNYRQVFIPEQDLRPIVGYIFNDDQETEDLFFDEEEEKLVQGGIQKETIKNEKKNFLLQRLNKNINDFNDEVNKQQQKEEMEQAVKRVVYAKLNKEDSQKKYKNNMKLSKQQDLINNKNKQDINWIQRETSKEKIPLQRVGRGGKQTLIEDIPKSILNKSKNHTISPDKKQVRFNEQQEKDESKQNKTSKFREQIKITRRQR